MHGIFLIMVGVYVHQGDRKVREVISSSVVLWISTGADGQKIVFCSSAVHLLLSSTNRIDVPCMSSDIGGWS